MDQAELVASLQACRDVNLALSVGAVFSCDDLERSAQPDTSLFRVARLLQAVLHLTFRLDYE